MANLYFRQLDFHYPDSEEKKIIIKKQNILILKLFLLRLLIYSIFVLIGVIFQKIARTTMPVYFGSKAPVELMYFRATLIETGFSVISITQLLFYYKVMFRFSKYEIIHVDIISKYTVVNMKQRVLTERFRYAGVEYNGNFILDRAEIRGPLTYLITKTNRDGFVIRIGDNTHYDYQLIC